MQKPSHRRFIEKVTHSLIVFGYDRDELWCRDSEYDFTISCRWHEENGRQFLFFFDVSHSGVYTYSWMQYRSIDPFGLRWDKKKNSLWIYNHSNESEYAVDEFRKIFPDIKVKYLKTIPEHVAYRRG